jgi:hypothetical protein
LEKVKEEPEHGSNGVMGLRIPIVPTLHHSITPMQFTYFFAGAGFLPMAASNSL